MVDSSGSFFSLHILIEQTAGLNGTDGETMDPKIKINALGETKYTTVKKGVAPSTSLIWNEHYFFSKSVQSLSQLDDEFVEICVVDSSKTFRSTSVGSFTLNMAAIYHAEGRKISHTWNVLQNRGSQKDYDKAQGYLKFSASLSKDDEPKVSLFSNSHPSKQSH